MSREILVPVDGSEPAQQALSFASEHHPEADITAYYAIDLVSVVHEPLVGTPPEYEQQLYEARREEAETLLSDAEATAEEHGVDIETEYERGLPREAILEYAADNDVDQIVIGSRGRTGLSRVLLGSVAEKVTRHSPVPVTIVHPDESEE